MISLTLLRRQSVVFGRLCEKSYDFSHFGTRRSVKTRRAHRMEREKHDGLSGDVTHYDLL